MLGKMPIDKEIHLEIFRYIVIGHAIHETSYLKWQILFFKKKQSIEMLKKKKKEDKREREAGRRKKR